MMPIEVTEKIAELKKILDNHAELVGFQKDKVTEVTHTLWSRGPALSSMPLGLELSGVKPCKFLRSEPQNKKNVCRYDFSGEQLIKTIYYGSKGTVIGEESNILFNDAIIYLRIDHFGLPVRITSLEVENGIPKIGCRLENDGEFWYSKYVCQGSQIRSIVTYATNSLPGTEVLVEYLDDEVESLHFMNGMHRVNVYKA